MEMEERERAWKEEDLLFPTKTFNWKTKQPLTLTHPLDPAVSKLPSHSPQRSDDSCRLCSQRCSSWLNAWRSKTGSSAWRSSGSSPHPSWTASSWWDLASSTSSAPSPFSWLRHILERRCQRTSSDGRKQQMCRVFNLPGCCFRMWIKPLFKYIYIVAHPWKPGDWCMLLYRPSWNILFSGFSAPSHCSRETKKQNEMSGSKEVMKHTAIKRDEEENESDGWEGNEAEGTRAEDSCNYTAETKRTAGGKNCWGSKSEPIKF